MLENINLWAFWDFITIGNIIKMWIFYFFLIWIATIFWVIRDISNRSYSIIFQVFCVMIILFLTPLGIWIYLLIRPKKTLFEKYYDDIEHNLNSLSDLIKNRFNLSELENNFCPKCSFKVEKNFKFCPNCQLKLNFKK